MSGFWASDRTDQGKDTSISTKPVFTKKTDEITLEEGEDDVNFSVYFKAEDLSKVSLVYVTDEVDYDTPGTYSAMVRAVDASGNISEQSFQIIVEEKEEPVSLITEEAQVVSDDSSLSLDHQQLFRNDRHLL